MSLVEMVVSNTERGKCKCGMHIDEDDKPDLQSRVSDVQFFTVALKEGSALTANQLKEQIFNYEGAFLDIDLFDGKEHNYIRIGAWLGGQHAALLLMGLGELLGLWKLLTPNKMFPMLPDDEKLRLARQGLVSIKVT